MYMLRRLFPWAVAIALNNATTWPPTDLDGHLGFVYRPENLSGHLVGP